ncbi:MAG TPA: hypothetical protein VJT31_40450 [Rugosimonospora sp.]|nr:hypothetical protein [Rugosimonospora sp.]
MGANDGGPWRDVAMVVGAVVAALLVFGGLVLVGGVVFMVVIAARQGVSWGNK